MSNDGEVPDIGPILRRQRASLKSRITLFAKYVDKVETEAQAGTSVPILQLKARLENVNMILPQFEGIQLQIDSITDTIPPEEEAYRSNFEDSFYEATTKATELLIKESSQSPDTNNPINISDNANNTGIKLPTIHLPKFDGSFENWLDFHDSFNSMIVQNSNISPVQKFHYLKSSLQGSAEKVISSLSISSSNFAVAWDLICKRFSNKQLLLHNHIKAIFNLKSITKESSSTIRHLVDGLSSNLRSLETLGQPVKHWDALMIYILLDKLDTDTVKDWEKHCSDRNSSLDELLKFVKNKADILEKLELSSAGRTCSKSSSFANPNVRPKTYTSKSLLTTDSPHMLCGLCKGAHKLSACNSFQALDVNKRIAEARKLQICFNCLHSGHQSTTCKFGKCKTCGKKHHTLLHTADNPNQTLNSGNNLSNQATQALSTSTSHNLTLLSTVIVGVTDCNGVQHECRALLDSGSESNYVTTHLVNKLGLVKERTSISVIGIAQLSSRINHKCSLSIHSLNYSFSTSLTCLVTDGICKQIPSCQFDVSSLSIPENIRLSDSNFNVPSHIDILIGAGIFWDLLCVGQVKLGPRQPILQKTKLGWIISGPLPKLVSSQISCNFSHTPQCDEISRFWEIEECSVPQLRSKEESRCEEIFASTYTRNSDGRFVVTIPLRDSVERLGESKTKAEKRFYALERKFQGNPQMKERYISFMDEYESMGHMSRCEHIDSPVKYYLPHHGVLKESSLTTKLRVVFDGSSASSSGFSCNDIQLVGPVIQSDLFSILLRFRQYSYVVSADIAKMYRQILVSPSQRNLQLILWRRDPSETLQSYSLNTVTYGTAAASFLATRCLMQLSYDSSQAFPQASKIIANDFYVDDLLTGSNSSSELLLHCKQVSQILEKGCFPLRKWISNDPTILEGIEDAMQSSDAAFSLGPSENTKTLGLQWCPNSDSLLYSIQSESFPSTITKRSILSGIAHIFDPLGLLGASVIKVKILLQRLWLEKLGWDQSVPLDIHTSWLSFKNQIGQLNNLQIPRHVILRDSVLVELHGFSDASEAAYGAAIYIRSIDSAGTIAVHLLCAKSRVAPLKKISVPRLELCGALILSRLAKTVASSISIDFHNTFLWTDSTIVLGWINTSPHLLKTFIGNRVSEIQSNTEIDQWRHVGTKDNPADLLSRGLEPAKLKVSKMWWNGPSFLSGPPGGWPLSDLKAPGDLPELKHTSHSMVTSPVKLFQFENFSSFSTLQRVIAYCLRFRRIITNRNVSTALTTEELKNALFRIIRMVQGECFSMDLQNLKSNLPISSKSKILSLNPFLDNEGIIRVGGRLRNSPFNFEKRHPILLPAHHHVTNLLFRSEHSKLFHAGPQHLLAVIRERYWPISGRTHAKKAVRECVRCFRAKPSQIYPIMGDLPSSRVTPSFAFAVTGVDYAGPYFIKSKLGRNPSTYKAYVSLFVCLASKAIHLELVTDLTTDSFIAALKRFTSRRGKPAQMMSDNGTNFVGTGNELRDLGNFLRSNQNEIIDICAQTDINWQFIPAHSPHFGGIWEAGVKSMKAHLKRIMLNVKLTYEDFSTVLTQVEGILNSRPLAPLSSDPSDLLPLTPAHFLIGRPMHSIADPDFLNVYSNRLSRFQQLQQLRQHFWTRWSLEYISELQQRQKWKKNHPNIKVGTLVLVKDKNLPPLNWLLGRIDELHPGADGAVRVVTVRTAKGLIRRATTTVCPLSCEEQGGEE